MPLPSAGAEAPGAVVAQRALQRQPPARPGVLHEERRRSIVRSAVRQFGRRKVNWFGIPVLEAVGAAADRW